jgi:hypothetical protein
MYIGYLEGCFRAMTADGSALKLLLSSGTEVRQTENLASSSFCCR